MRTHKLTLRLIVGSFLIALGLLLVPALVSATTPAPSSGSTPAVTCNQLNPDGTTSNTQVDCSQVKDPATTGGNCQSLSSCDLVSKYINPLIAFLGALVGIVVVASIIIGAIQYSSSGGNPQAAAGARKHIQNALIALVAYIFLVAILNFIVPGGLL